MIKYYVEVRHSVSFSFFVSAPERVGAASYHKRKWNHVHSPDDKRDGVALQPVGLEDVVVTRQKTIVVGHYPLVAAPAPSRSEAVRHRQDIPVLYQRVLYKVSVRQGRAQHRRFAAAVGVER